MLSEKLESQFDVVKEGTVCAISSKGKDACQVSSWALRCLCILAVLPGVPHPQAVGPTWSGSASVTCLQVEGLRGQATKALLGWSDLMLQERGPDAA